jgi:hypothetical protein
MYVIKIREEEQRQSMCHLSGLRRYHSNQAEISPLLFKFQSNSCLKVEKILDESEVLPMSLKTFLLLKVSVENTSLY